MGNSSSTRSISSKIPSVSVQPLKTPEDPSLAYCIKLFKMVHPAGDATNVIDAINKLLDSIENKSKKDKRQIIVESETKENGSLWRSLLSSGSVFLEFVNKHIQKGQEKGDFISQLGETRKHIAEILQAVGKTHWIVGGLSIVAYLIDQIDQMRENRTDCLELLRQMLKLASHIRQLNYDMPQYEKKFSEAIFLIFEGSMMCASQLNSKALFRLEYFFIARLKQT